MLESFQAWILWIVLRLNGGNCVETYLWCSTVSGRLVRDFLGSRSSCSWRLSLGLSCLKVLQSWGTSRTIPISIRNMIQGRMGTICMTTLIATYTQKNGCLLLCVPDYMLERDTRHFPKKEFLKKSWCTLDILTPVSSEVHQVHESKLNMLKRTLKFAWDFYCRIRFMLNKTLSHTSFLTVKVSQGMSSNLEWYQNTVFENLRWLTIANEYQIIVVTFSTFHTHQGIKRILKRCFFRIENLSV